MATIKIRMYYDSMGLLFKLLKANMRNLSIVILLLFLVGCVSIKNPASDAPFVYKIGWWPYQEHLDVTALDVKVIDSGHNLASKKSLIFIAINGTMKGDNGRRPYISSVHISEKVIKEDNIANNEAENQVTQSNKFKGVVIVKKVAEILVTPIIQVKEDKGYKGELVEFKLNQELILNSLGWGINKYNIISQNHKKTVEIRQRIWHLKTYRETTGLVH